MDDGLKDTAPIVRAYSDAGLKRLFAVVNEEEQEVSAATRADIDWTIQGPRRAW